MKKKKILYLLVGLAIFLASCNKRQVIPDNGRPNVVTTTTLVGDLVENIGQDRVNVISLMGPGVDPHMYKASAGDVTNMQAADMIIYSGLHLEGKMGDIFENLAHIDKLILSVTEDIPKSSLLDFESSPGNFDPHVWFDVSMWKQAAISVAGGLEELMPEEADFFQANLEAYLLELDQLDDYIRSRAQELDREQRILVTAHDAFSYFGRAYDFQVKGLQGISTSAEAGTSNVRDLANFIVEREIKAVFVESSVPRKSIEALQEAVRAQGFQLDIGGELYSDSTGSRGTEAESYVGTLKANIDTIVDALK